MDSQRSGNGSVTGALALMAIGVVVLVTAADRGSVLGYLLAGAAIAAGGWTFARAGRAAPGGVPQTPDPGRSGAGFSIVLRGYDVGQVDALIGRAGQALASGSPAERSEAAAAIRAARLEVALRGYDRFQVDAHLEGLASQLAGGASAGGDPAL